MIFFKDKNNLKHGDKKILYGSLVENFDTYRNVDSYTLSEHGLLLMGFLIGLKLNVLTSLYMPLLLT